MAGTIVVNVSIGIIAFVITLVTALSGNVFFVSLERAVYAFILFFLLAFPIRWLGGAIFAKAEEKETETAGSQIDLVTPDDPILTKPQEDDGALGADFTPLTAAILERKDEAADPTNIANVIRRLTDD